MRSLQIKLIFMFYIVNLVGTGFIFLLNLLATPRLLNELLVAEATGSFAMSAQHHYQVNRSWDDFSLPASLAPNGQPLATTAFPIILADANRRIQIPVGPYQKGDLLPYLDFAQSEAVLVDGKLVGVIGTENPILNYSPAARIFLQRSQALLVLGALGTTGITVVLGAVLAHLLTRPLRELASASQAVAGGELKKQLPVRTQDELGKLAAAFNQMSMDLTHAIERRRQMTADIAHELRTPLTVLAGYLESIREGTLAPTASRVALMDQEVQRLTRLVEDLRTLTLADAGELSLQCIPIAPEELLQRIYGLYAQQAKAQQVTLSLQVPPELPTIHVDPERMVQVLGNLVSNSLRYTASGGEIILSAKQQDGAVLLRVQDNGEGIPPEDLPHIFERFYRGDKARQRTKDESGLGLTIARSLVEAHKGTIEVASEPGEGTIFTIKLKSDVVL